MCMAPFAVGIWIRLLTRKKTFKRGSVKVESQLLFAGAVINEDTCFRQVSFTSYCKDTKRLERSDGRDAATFHSGSELSQDSFFLPLFPTLTHFHTRVWCMSVLAGWGRQGQKTVVGAVARRGKILQHKPGLKKWGGASWIGGAKGGMRKRKGGRGGGVGESWGVSDEEWGWRVERRKGGRCFLSPFLPAHIDNQREETIRPHDILSGSLAFPPCRVMCLLPSLPFPPPLPPFLCPSKLRHVISHHKNRGGKTRWRYRCLRVSGTKAACKYSRERRRSRGRRRAREDRGHRRRR